MAFLFPFSLIPADGISHLATHLSISGSLSSQPGLRPHSLTAFRQRLAKPAVKSEAVTSERSSTVAVPSRAEDWPSPSSAPPKQASSPTEPPATTRRRSQGRKPAASEQTATERKPGQERRGRPRKTPQAAEGSIKLFSSSEAGVNSPTADSQPGQTQDSQLRRRQRGRTSRSPAAPARGGQAASLRTQPSSEDPLSPLHDAQIPRQQASRQQPASRKQGQPSQRSQQYQSRTPDRTASAVRQQRSLSPPPASQVSDVANSPGQLTAESERVLCLAIKVQCSPLHSDVSYSEESALQCLLPLCLPPCMYACPKLSHLLHRSCERVC